MTDNAANMKFAFHMAADDNDDTPEFDDSYSDMHEDDENEFVESLEGWTVTPIHFDGWIGCAAHKLQLVVHMGYKELLVFRKEFKLPFVSLNLFVLSLVSQAILNMHYLPEYRFQTRLDGIHFYVFMSIF